MFRKRASIFVANGKPPKSYKFGYVKDDYGVDFNMAASTIK